MNLITCNIVGCDKKLNKKLCRYLDGQPICDEHAAMADGVEVVNPVKKRLEYLRKEIRAERISYGEVAELQALASYIDSSDIELLEWAGVKEKTK